MKRLLTIISICAVVALHAQELRLDVPNSTCSWTCGGAGGYVQTGTIAPESGSLNWENGTIESGVLVFDMSTITNADESLASHLRAKDFFHVKKYPQATFTFTSMEGTRMAGRLTIRGVTLDEAFEVVLEEKDGRIELTGEAEIDRTSYGIKYNSESFFQDIGSYAIDDVFTLTFDLSFRSAQ